MNNTPKPRTWSELRKRRERAGSANNTSRHSISVHTAIDLDCEPAIHTFENFKLLRETYEELRKIPTPMFRDWIACCQEHISHDIIGNTPQENKENNDVANAFREFSESYEILASDSSLDEDVRTQQIQLALLHLLRSILIKPTNLAKTLLTCSIGPIE